jgi:hypothetical protein
MLTPTGILRIYGGWIALLRRHNALNLPKNVLYIKNNPMTTKNAATEALPSSGALFFAALESLGSG